MGHVEPTPAKTVKDESNFDGDHNPIQRYPGDLDSDFAALVCTGSPFLIERAPLGRCTQLWTSDYLKQKVGPLKTVR